MNPADFDSHLRLLALLAGYGIAALLLIWAATFAVRQFNNALTALRTAQSQKHYLYAAKFSEDCERLRYENERQKGGAK